MTNADIGTGRQMVVTINGLDFDTEAIPSIEELGVNPEILEIAAMIVGDADCPGAGSYTVELLVRTIVFVDRMSGKQHSVRGRQCGRRV